MCPRFLSPQKPRIPGFCRLKPTTTPHCPIAAPTPTLVSNPPSPAKAGIQRARQRSAHGAEGREGCVFLSSQKPRIPGFCRPNQTTTPHCPIAAPTPTLVVGSRESPVIPAKAGIQRARQRSAHGAEGREGLCPRFLSPQKPRIPRFCRLNPTTTAHYAIAPLIATLFTYAVPRESPVIPAKAGIQRARQRSAHGAEGREGCVRGSCLRRNLASLGSAALTQRQLPITP